MHDWDSRPLIGTRYFAFPDGSAVGTATTKLSSFGVAYLNSYGRELQERPQRNGAVPGLLQGSHIAEVVALFVAICDSCGDCDIFSDSRFAVDGLHVRLRGAHLADPRDPLEALGEAMLTIHARATMRFQLRIQWTRGLFWSRHRSSTYKDTTG